MDLNKELIQAIRTDFPLGSDPGAGMDGLHTALSRYINDLIINDFPKLINLLYRLDVSEKKLQQWLLDNTAEDAGKIIASLVIERQLQKIQSRSQFRPKDDQQAGGEEKW